MQVSHEPLDLGNESGAENWEGDSEVEATPPKKTRAPRQKRQPVMPEPQMPSVEDMPKRFINLLDAVENLGVDQDNDSYRYLSTGKALSYAKEKAKEFGFIIIQRVDLSVDGHTFLQTTIFDRNSMAAATTPTVIPLSSHVDVRKMGAEITCLRRYAIMLALGIVSVADDDEGVLDGKPPRVVSNKVTSKPKAEVVTPNVVTPTAKAEVVTPKGAILLSNAEATKTQEKPLAQPSRETLIVLFDTLEAKNMLRHLKDTQIASLRAFKEGTREYSDRDIAAAATHLGRILTEKQ